MVAALLRLRLALWRGALRRDTWRVVVLVLGGLYGLGMLAAALVGLAALAGAPIEVARAVVVAGGALLVLGWTLVPLLAFGVDPSLDPARFATLPVPPRPLAVGQLLGALLGVPGALTLLLGAGTALAWLRGPAAPALGVLGVVGGVVGVLTAVALGRLVTSAAAGVLGGRRAGEATAVVGVLALTLLGPAFAAAGAVVPAVDLDDLARALDVLAWTPLGLAWAAPADAAAGAWGTALVRLALAVAVLLALVLAWAAVLARRLVSARPPSAAAPAHRRDLLARLPEGPRWAVAARCLRYWRRDPRYVAAAASALALPVVLAALAGLGTLPAGALWVVGPVAGLLLGASLHNDVALDGPAFWAHLAAGLPGREDRAGRTAALLLWGLPLVVVASVVGAVVAGAPWSAGAADPGDWLGRAAGALGAALGLLLSGAGVSAVVSAVRPYPAQAAGDSPFSSPSGAALPGALAQLVTTGATGLLALPAVALALASALWPWCGALALVAGAGLGTLVVREGVRRGGALLDRRGPELLAAVRRDR
ncbi:hypothetical protein [uncultured Pseudokineococcus sp.]|uniref:hypothetical protein n=1 Tax=uncultured Pseudokineococcus sp. TaxID=1642928 RepID=UPI00260EAE78|nr:hypothetical protein [uncultured Pseudokineococcus sp.]